MTISKVFKSTIPSQTYVFKTGAVLEFVGGRATIEDDEQVAELMSEVKTIGQGKSKHPFIYIDETEQEIDSEALSPFEELKAKARKEVEEEMRRAMNSGPSTSEQGKFASSVSNTANNVPVGDSNSGAPALANIPAASVAALVAGIKK